MEIYDPPLKMAYYNRYMRMNMDEIPARDELTKRIYFKNGLSVKKGETEKDYVEGFFNITFVCDLAKELSEKMSGKEKELDVKEKIDENLVKNTKVPVEVVLGSTKESLKDILDYKPGKIIELDKLAGEPVEIRANGAVVGTGEVVVVNEKFGVRIVDLK